MSLKRTLTTQLGTILIAIMIGMLVITSTATYKTAYDKLYDAAGVEAFGCASITTGLIEPGDIVAIQNGDSQVAEEVGEQLNWTVEHKDIFETQYIIDLTGTILAVDENGKEFGLNQGDQVPFDQEAIDTLVKTKHPSYSSKPVTINGYERLSGYAPIFEDHDSTKEVIAISVIDFDQSIVSERTWDVVSNGILISIIPMILAGVGTIYLIRRKTKQISSLINQASEIANGNLAVEDITMKSHDEVGDLATTLNLLAANLREIIGTMQSTANQLTTNSSNTSVSLSEMQDALQQVADNMNDVTTSISNGNDSAGHASNILGDLDGLIHHARDIANTSVLNSEETMKIALEGEERVKEITLDMDKIRQASVESSTTIEGLIDSTSKIQDITNTISSIAAQTNLLALNASIEAARAGEHGKGFAVVAEEVRKLAEQSNDEVQKVESLIANITEHINQVVQSTEESTTVIESGSKTVHLTAEALSAVANAVERTVDEIGMISKSTETESESSRQVVELINRLTEEIQAIEVMSMNISAATEQTTASIDEVTQRSVETNELAQQLESVVSRFKL